MTQRLVFVGGLHRSGTTVLAQLLAEHPDITGLADTATPNDEGQHLQDVAAKASEMGGPGVFARDPRAHLTETTAHAIPDAAERLRRAWDPYWDTTAPWAVEKSPPNLLRMRFLQAAFPDASFIAIVRHPIAVALATQPWSGTPFDDLVDHWLGAHETFERDRDHLERLHFLRYEDLVADPAGVLGTIDGFLGVEPIERTISVRAGTNERYLRRFHHSRVLPRSLRGTRAQLRFGRRLDRLRYGYRFTDR